MPKKISQLTTGTPIDADSLPYVDSTGPTTKRMLWSVVKSTLKTYFDSLYQSSLGFTAVPNTRTVAGHALSADVTVSASDVGLGSVTNDAQIKAANFPSSAVDSEVVLFSGTGGKTVKRASATGLALVTSGVLSTVTAPSGTVVGTTDTQTLSNKTITPRVSTVTDGAGAVINASLGEVFDWSLGADRTAGTTTNPVEGQKMVIRALASGGARTLTLPTAATGDFRFGSDITALTQIASGKTDYIGCIYRGTRWDVVGYAKGY